MKISILQEAGLNQAILGLSLSYNTTTGKSTADRLAWKQGGHNKFLESIIVWIDITAPRYWWQQFDTYRVGTTKQSDSTMHTILKRPLISTDFEGGMCEQVLDLLNYSIKAGDFDRVKRLLPESFLQRRIVCTNYKTLQNMVTQRQSHRLEEWQFFIAALKLQLQNTDYVIKPNKETLILKD
jgi:hypothetical protein